MKKASLLFLGKVGAGASERQLLATLAADVEPGKQALGMTGIVVLANGHLLGVLEGVEADLLATFRKLKTDQRHESLEMVSCRPIADVEFHDLSVNVVQIREKPAVTGQRVEKIRKAIGDAPRMRHIDAVAAFAAP